MTASPKATRPRSITAAMQRLLAFTTTSAIAALTLVFIDANDPKITFADAEIQAGTALKRIGFDWAKVQVEDGIARVRGAAPSESERVIAFEVVRKSLRPMMGRNGIIASVASDLTLTPDAQVGIARDNERRTRMVAESERRGPVTGAITHTAPSQSHTEVATAQEQTAALPAPTPESDSALFEPSAGPSPSDPEPVEVAAVAAPEAPAEAPAAAQAPAAATTAPATQAEPPHSAAIETAALDTPAPQPSSEPAAPQQQHQSAPAAPSIDTVSDCKAEFSEALGATMIVFASDSARIEKQSRSVLDKLAGIAKRCSKFKLVVEGHTDGSGRKGHNEALSKKRAEAVRWALVDRGVDMDHITAEGYGASRPIDRSGSDAAKARNRRIEFSVLEPTSRREPTQQSASSEKR